MSTADDEPPTGSCKIFQIHGDDMATLEELLPELMWFRPDLQTARQKVQWRRVQQIIWNVRWNYGPPLECHRIPASDEPTE